MSARIKINPPLFSDKETTKFIVDTNLSAKLLYSVLLSKSYKVIIVSDKDSEKLMTEISSLFYTIFGEKGKIFSFPSYKSFYNNISPHKKLEIERANTLWKMLEDNFDLIILPPETLISKIINPEDLIANSLKVKKGVRLKIEEIINKLDELGYFREERVYEKGEFAKRGGIVDFYPPHTKYPIRIEFFGKEVESIRFFEPGTQISIKEINSCTITPIKTHILAKSEEDKFLKFLEKKFKDEKYLSHLKTLEEEFLNGEYPPGIEFLIKKFKNHRNSIFDYLNSEVVFVIFEENIYDYLETHIQREKEKYEENIYKGIPAFKIEDNYISIDELKKILSKNKKIIFSLFKSDKKISHEFTNYNRRNPIELLKFLKKEDKIVLFFLPLEKQIQQLVNILKDLNLPYEIIKNNTKNLEKGIFYISKGKISYNFYFGKDFIFLSEKPLFKESAIISKNERNIRRLSNLISDYKNLREGDYIVHAIYGVGIFRGIKKMEVSGLKKEVIEIEYRDGDKVFVPVERFDLIYKHNLETKPVLEKLGSKNWERVKKRVKKGIREMARELIKLYAERELIKGFSYPPDDEYQREFENFFEFEETPDQIRTIKEVKNDMEKPKPMERLICGDVGFGKTEVAMRAAFKAVMAGKQVAFLTPTTVLSFQHYNTFKKRFSQFPINIEFLSRFKTKREQKEIIKKISTGEIDVIIGTHRLLSKDVIFKNLGLLIVDEEQRFGVRHKEKIKILNKKIDVMYMSATPIPRTLYMSLSGIRNISVIETPPVNRLAIQTQISTFSPEIIKNGILNELNRGGQIFFVHNRIENIFEVGNYIQKLIPQAKVKIAHGKMKEKDLEKIMLDFIEKKFDVLVTTTIIENGIDMPNVNTIFINEAHKFGLAQLYQLRGRVGRSDVPAYAYLLTPPIGQLNEKAKERLLALKDLNELGSGFKLASLDMKLRGAGNILGPQQHGFMEIVGFELYTKWLYNEINKIKGKREFLSEDVEISLGIRIEIPDDYIPEMGERIKLYKQIASATSEEEISDLKKAIGDQYGKFPKSFTFLFDFTSIRLLAQKCGISSIKRYGNKLKIKFMPDTNTSPEKIMDVIKKYESSSFSPDGTLTIKFDKINENFILNFLKNFLKSLL